MMQSTDVRDRDDMTLTWRLDFPRIGRVAFEREVRSRLVIVREIAAEDPEHVHDHAIQTLAPDRADKPLDVRALSRRAVGDDDFFDAHMFDALLEIQTGDAIAITSLSFMATLMWYQRQ